MQFAANPDFFDESFAGNISGVALDYKIRPFENKCITMERQFEKGLREQWKLIAPVWALTKNIFIDAYQIKFVFTRNYPQNILEESQIQMNLKGVVSDQTRLSIFSTIKDPDEELKQIEEEQSDIMDLNTAKNLTSQETDESII
jgi:SPP1 family phage portal protein